MFEVVRAFIKQVRTFMIVDALEKSTPYHHKLQFVVADRLAQKIKSLQ